jgi:hypothetical protein
MQDGVEDAERNVEMVKVAAYEHSVDKVGARLSKTYYSNKSKASSSLSSPAVTGSGHSCRKSLLIVRDSLDSASGAGYGADRPVPAMYAVCEWGGEVR